jgi:hypothetical protein
VGFPKIYITPKDSSYAYHDFPFQFGSTELAGLKIFLNAALAGIGTNQHAGNCDSCHTAQISPTLVFTIPLSLRMNTTAVSFFIPLLRTLSCFWIASATLGMRDRLNR